MRLIVKQYLAGLRERDELDSILPDLLSQMGLSVFSTPARGTRQDGVDVAAVGAMNGNDERVYLLSVKSGNLSRSEWNSISPQSLRPSLDSIIDAFIPNRIPQEHRKKKVIICIVVGGVISEQVRSDITQYELRNANSRISFEEWNNDILAEHIIKHLLSEHLLPVQLQSSLRKSLALIDEPEASYKHFHTLIATLSESRNATPIDELTSLRQMCICIWTLYSWARDADNLESAYLSAELTLLHSWDILRRNSAMSPLKADQFAQAFSSIFKAYHYVTADYVRKIVTEGSTGTHVLSSSIQSHDPVTVNLRLFDLLGRIAIHAIFLHWTSEMEVTTSGDLATDYRSHVDSLSLISKSCILSNPLLYSPLKDEFAIEVFLAGLLFRITGSDFLDLWLDEMLDRLIFSLKTRSMYPTVHRDYENVLLNTEASDDEVFKDNTSASVLYPMIGLLGSLSESGQLLHELNNISQNLLPHCNMQAWYPGPTSETHLYRNSDTHGETLSGISFDQPATEYIATLFQECQMIPDFNSLSAVVNGWWPLVLVACRHYRLPPPIHLLRDLEVHECEIE